MRRDVVGIGAILVIFGVFLYLIGNNMVESAPYNILSGGGLSKYQSDIETGQSLVGIGVMLTLIGLCAAVAGFISKDSNIVDSVKNERFCPKCGRKIPFDSKICPFCKHDFEKHLKDDEVKTEPIKDVNPYVCSKCGSENTANAKFCADCGTKL